MAEEITTAAQPPCKLCTARRFVTWDPKSGPMARVPLSAFYVRVAGTTGLYRHVCPACLHPNDLIVARFVAPKGD